MGLRNKIKYIRPISIFEWARGLVWIRASASGVLGESRWSRVQIPPGPPIKVNLILLLPALLFRRINCKCFRSPKLNLRKILMLPRNQPLRSRP